jgi:hypothetical protein
LVKHFDNVSHLSVILESTVRIELSEQIFGIAMHCMKRLHVGNVTFDTCLLPIIVRLLSDHNGQVRDLTHVFYPLLFDCSQITMAR